MKKTLSIILSLVMILTALPLTAINSFANTSGDWYYRVLDDGTAELYRGTYEAAYSGTATNVTIPSKIDGYTVTSIGEYAFYDCDSLKSISMPNSIKNIGLDAFEYCNSLTSITIPASVTSIGDYAFAHCTSLTSVTIPNSVTSIGNYAFNGCESLKSIAIPNSVTSIGNYAFNGCESLKSIAIPNSVTSIGWCAFSDTAYYNNKSNWKNGVLYIGNHLITAESDNVPKDYKIKEGTITIADDAFSCSTSLTSITIPNSVTSIGNYAFNGCESLKSIAIPNRVTSIGNYAFNGCESLKSIAIPNSVTSIGWCAFSDTAYYNNKSNWKNGVLYIGNHLITAESDNVPKDYKIKEGTITIADDAFSCSTSLTSVTIPNSVTSIGNYAFNRCESLKSIAIPNSVTSIGDSAFENCTSLTSIIISNSVTSIGLYAFYNCWSLKSITIGNSVASIGYDAFYECNDLETVYYTGSETDWKSISIYDDNEALTNANIIYNAHIVYLNANGGECSTASKPVEYNGTYGTLPNPTKAGYIFNGWFTQDNGGSLVTINTIVSNDYDHTLYAHWTALPKTAEIIEEPYQTLYYIGDEISLNGIQVKITYYDDSTEFVTADQLSFTGDTSTAGKNKDLVVSYTENGETVTATTKITVKKPSARSYCDGLETDEIYLIGSGRFTLETTPSGLPARWESSNKNIISITSDGYYKVTGRGETKITAYFDYNGITYEKDVLINVTGTAKSVTNVQPAQDSYYVGEEFNNKVSFHAVIDDGFGNISEVDVVDHRGPDGDTSTPGEKTVTFDYFGVTVSYTYTVDIAIEDSETDVNGDGKLTVVDAKWILQSVAGTRTLTDEQKIAADVNGDDKVTVVDAKWILQAIAGMRDLSKK